MICAFFGVIISWPFLWWRISCVSVRLGSPTPGPWTGTGPPPVRNQAAQQEVSGGQASEASPAAPHRSPSLAIPPEHRPPTPPSLEILSSMKLVPGAKKVGDRCVRLLMAASNRKSQANIYIFPYITRIL